MKVIVDERETMVYQLCTQIQQSTLPNLILEKRVLELGDFLFTNDDESTIYMLIERKTFADLLASIKDGRYAEQSHRLTHCYPQTHNTVYLLEGMFTASMSDADKRKIFSCIASLNYFKGFSVMRTVTMAETAQQIMYMADKVGRDLKDGKTAKYSNSIHKINESNSYTNVEGNAETQAQAQVEANPYCSVVKSAKKANITRENIGEIILCQIPGISAVTAVSLMRPFASFGDFIDKIRAEPEYLDGLKVDNGNGTKPRKLGSNIIASIKQYLV